MPSENRGPQTDPSSHLQSPSLATSSQRPCCSQSGMASIHFLGGLCSILLPQFTIIPWHCVVALSALGKLLCLEESCSTNLTS